MNFKKRVNGSWVDIPYYIHKTATDTFTTLPITIYADGTAITSYTISGNTIQNGTPTPSNPVDVNGVGERTANIFDGTLLGGHFLDANFELGGNTSVFKSIKVFLPAGTYTFSWGKNVNIVRKIIDGSYSENLATNVTSYTVTSTTDDHVGISFRDTTSSSTVWDVATPIMLNTGSTAKPYEPYGYKIPISNGQQTTNIYLGSTQSVRQIYKLVFDGTENWSNQNVGQHGAVSIRKDEMPSVPNMPAGTLTIVSSHFKAISNSAQLNIGEMVAGGSYLNFDYDGTNNLTDFKAYLAAQYANGTPVTIWYILATPETATVNEPLMKIGDYADTLSNATAIPTTEGANSITVDTTVQPSEFTVNYKGWHPVQSVHKYDSNYTIATMQALTIVQLQTHTISELQGGEWS